MTAFVVAVNGALCCLQASESRKKEQVKHRMETRKKKEGKVITPSVHTKE